MKGVLEQVDMAIKPMQEKQSKLEQEQVIMQEQISNLLQEVKEMKEKKSSEENTTHANSSSLAQSKVQVKAPEVVNGKDSKSEHYVDAARRTLGFQSVYPSDVERQFRVSGARSQAEARWFAIREFSECELKVSRDVF